jgi:MYXO-CTERM domain-containing protein
MPLSGFSGILLIDANLDVVPTIATGANVSIAGSPVPEPVTGALALLGLAAVFLRRRKSCGLLRRGIRKNNLASKAAGLPRPVGDANEQP